MSNSPILLPAAVLILWSLLILFAIAATRLPAMQKAGVSLFSIVGGRGVDLEGVVPDQVSWISHNYTHLMEQPTIFYPRIVILALTGADGATNVALAWAYVGLRMLHSLVQVLWNRVAVRFLVFLFATGALALLAINALLAALA